MKPWKFPRRVGACAALALSLFGISATLAEAEESDNASLRRRAKEQWYNETSTVDRKPGRGRVHPHGGPWSQGYRRFVLETAKRERARWLRVVARPGGSRRPVMTGVPSKVGSTWVNLGPTKADFIKNGSTTLNKTDSGRIRTIVVDPTNTLRIFLATATGGVWRSTDGGTTWTGVTESLGTLSCGALAMDPSNPQVLYLALGDPFDGTGIGLVKSTDGGDTWSDPVYLGLSMVTTDIMVAPGAPNIVLATTDQGLFRSKNGGATWDPVPLATGQAEAPYGWSLAWVGGSSFVLSLEALSSATTGTTDGQIWFSGNNGASWIRATGVTKASGVGRITVASAPSNRRQLYAVAAVPNATSVDLADLFKSIDGGATWTALNVGNRMYSNGSRDRVNATFNGQGWYDHLLVINPTNADSVYIGGALYLGHTPDGGSTFTQLSAWLAQFSLPYVHADFHTATFDSSGTFYVGSDGGIFKSTDSGATWTDALNVGLVTHLLYSVGSSTANRDAVIGGLQDNGTRLRDGSTSTFNQVVGGDGFGSHIHATNANLMLGSLYNSRIQKSTNGGTTWAQACSGITECGGSGAPFYTKLEPWVGDPTGNTLYTSSNTRVYRTTNYASSWTALGTSGLPTASFAIRNVGVARSDGNVVGLVASGGRVYLSSNGGATWTLSTPTNNGLSLSYIHFSTSDRNTVYVASVAPGANWTHLWKSTDFGANWTEIDGGGFPSGVPVDVIKNDPTTPTTLYAGTHMGVYVSTDAGATWARLGTGMPLVEVTDLYISPDATLVRAATYGRGYWELQ